MPGVKLLLPRNLIRCVRTGHNDGTLGSPNCPSCFSVALESAASDDRRWVLLIYVNKSATLAWGPINLAFRLIGVVPAKDLAAASGR